MVDYAKTMIATNKFYSQPTKGGKMVKLPHTTQEEHMISLIVTGHFKDTQQ